MSTVTRWNPFREIAAMQSALDRVIDDAWRSGPREGNFLALDVHDNGNAYTVVADLPGVSVDDIHVNLHDGQLTISTTLNEPEVHENGRVLVQERTFGDFTRTINLPQPVNPDNVEANYNDGVLTLTLPKTPEVQPRQIPVRINKK